MATCGADSRMKVWDLRTYGLVSDYFTPEVASSLAISQTGLLAVGCTGGLVQVWKDWHVEKQKEPYMKHSTENLGKREGRGVCEVKYAPFEDFLGIGTKGGFQSAVVPGSGFAGFDAFEENPFESRKQRREGEVAKLLEKLQPSTITLDPGRIGTVDKAAKSIQEEE